ncbi:hypothetical protein CCAX7_16530 [Capsulimonas corticalis]|uniref:Uncharacterized protein n=2 Tax=Capsulimonas corticalis TaxID=2219043 RepID=A0A402CYX0_9BACT|nr:hypothetical protein CCAX7_16530 [Capsulimonas corticalis]
MLSIAALCLVVSGGCARLRADNLAAAASYSVALSGYIYPGQVIPGAGVAAIREGYADGPPWRDTSTALTDGRRDGKAVQSWFWSNMTKRITVRFDLRRSARVTSLAVWPLAGSQTDFDRVEAHVSDTEAGLSASAAIPLDVSGGAAYHGPPLTGRYVLLVCESAKPWMSLSEVEITGDPLGAIAAGAPPPGLVPPPVRDPRQLAELPARARGAVDLARKPGVRIAVSAPPTGNNGATAGSPIPAGVARALIGGGHPQTVRSADGFYADKFLILDLDLGGVRQVDRVIVRSAASDPAKRSYFNGYRVSLKSSAGFWEPVGDADNPLLPGESVDGGYSVTSPSIEKPARYVRVRLRCAPQSGDRIEIGGVEVWGRTIAGVVVQASPRPVLKPRISPAQPRGAVASDYDWILRDRIRAMYAMTGDETNGALLDRITQSGFNTVLMHTMGAAHSADGWPRMAQTLAKIQKQHGLRVIVSWPYGSDERYANAQFGEYQPGGKARWTHAPCPLSAPYWNAVVGDRAEIAARAGLTGLVVDVEMYGADATRYPGPCYCDDCWRRFVSARLGGAPAAAKVDLDNRPAWIAENGLEGDYARWQAQGVSDILRGIRKRVAAVAPHFLFGNLLDLEAIPGLAAGFGTPQRPALVFSETEYSGDFSKTSGQIANIRTSALPALYIPGLWVKPITPPQIPDLAARAAGEGAGYWIWSASAFTDGHYPHASGYTNDEYWKAFRDANNALDTRLKH